MSITEVNKVPHENQGNLKSFQRQQSVLRLGCGWVAFSLWLVPSWSESPNSGMSESNLLQRLKMKGKFVDTSADGITIKDGFLMFILFVYGLCLLLSLYSYNREIELEVASCRVKEQLDSQKYYL